MPRSPHSLLTSANVDDMLHVLLNGDRDDAIEAFETFHRTAEAKAAKRTKQAERAWTIALHHGVHHFKIDNVLERFWKAPKYAMGNSNSMCINHTWRILRSWGVEFWGQLAERNVQLPQEPNVSLLSGLAIVAADEHFCLDEFSTEFIKWRSSQMSRDSEYQLQCLAASQRVVCDRDVNQFLEWIKGPHGARATEVQRRNAYAKQNARSKRARRPSQIILPATGEDEGLDALPDDENTSSETTPRMPNMDRVSPEADSRHVTRTSSKRSHSSSHNDNAAKRSRGAANIERVHKQETENFDAVEESSTLNVLSWETPTAEGDDMEALTRNGPLASPFRFLTLHSKRLGILRERVSARTTEIEAVIESHRTVCKRIETRQLPSSSNQLKARISAVKKSLLTCKSWEAWLKGCPPFLSKAALHDHGADDPLSRAVQPIRELKNTTTSTAGELEEQLFLHEEALAELEKADAAYNGALDAKEAAEKDLKAEEDVWENFLGAAMGLYERPIWSDGLRDQRPALSRYEEGMTNDGDSVMG